MKNRNFVFSLIFAAFFLPQLLSCETKKFNLPVKTLEIKIEGGTVSVQAEIAEKQQERSYGFMNRKKIPAGTGMLFVFEREQELSFWMKNTPTPLSIAYLDSSGRIIDIYDMKPYSLASVTSTRPAMYALEVPQGWFKNSGVKVGDRVRLP